MLNWFKRFIASLFAGARKGLEGFLKDNLPVIKSYVRGQIQVQGDRAFYEYEPEIFAYLRERVPNAVPDNWLSIAIKFAFEHCKKELLEAAQ
jgi:hypothetical protein